MALRYVAHFRTPGGEVWIGEVAGAYPWAAGGVISARGGLVVDSEPRISLEADGVESLDLRLVGDPLGLLANGPGAGAVLAEVALIDDGADWDDRETVISEARLTALTQSLGTSGQTITLTRDMVAESAVSLEDYTIRDTYRNKVYAGGDYYNQGKHDRPWPIAVGVCYGVPLIRWARETGDDYALVVGHHLPESDMAVYDRGVELLATGRYTATPENKWMSQGISAVPDLPDRAYSRFRGTDGTSNVDGPSWENEDGSLGNYCEGLSTRLVHGGVKNARQEVTIGAGMVLEYLLQESGLEVDWKRLAPTIQRLHAWDIGVYIDGRESWIALIRDRLIPVLPIREHQSDVGIWYSYHVPWERTPRGTITSGADFSHVGSIAWDMRVTNAVTIRYAYDYSIKDYSKAVQVGPDQSPLCAASSGVRAYGLRETSQPVTSTIIHTDTAALQAGKVLAEMNALPRRRFDVLFRSDSWKGLLPGETLLVASEFLGAGPVLCQVLEVPRRRWPGTVTLETVPRTTEGLPSA